MSVTVEKSIAENENNVQNNNKRSLEDTNDEVATKVQKIGTVDRIKRKNHVLMLSYFGKDFYGMQKNPGMKTIEGELTKALLKANLIDDKAFENLKLISFQRAARTDKGVSAIRQVVSLQLPETTNKDDINQHLPNEIRVFGIKRVTKGFNSKHQCDARTYRYVIPTFAFAPEDPSFLENKDAEQDVEKRLNDLSVINGQPYNEFRMSPELLNRVNETTKMFEGTHCYHNFTSKVKRLDPRAKRFIMQFSCTEVFTAENMEFAVFHIKGQSFMLHQIRKMMALVIGIIRNIASKNAINDAFMSNRFDIPIAPSLGLCLNYVHYDFYNKRYGGDGIHKTLDWEECEEEVKKFDQEYVLKNVISTEVTEKITLNWLANLTAQRFSDEEADLQEISNN